MDSKLTESGYWTPASMGKDEIKKLKKENIKLRGRSLESIAFIRYVRKSLGDTLDICCAECGSPFGIAQQVMGHDIFMETYDSPGLVHHLLEIALELIKNLAR